VCERVTHERPVPFVVATAMFARDSERYIGTQYRWCESEDEATAALAEARARVADVNDGAVGATMEPVVEDPVPAATAAPAPSPLA